MQNYAKKYSVDMYYVYGRPLMPITLGDIPMRLTKKQNYWHRYIISGALKIKILQEILMGGKVTPAKLTNSGAEEDHYTNCLENLVDNIRM